MNNQEIRIIYKEVGKDPAVIKINSSLATFEKLLGGEIEEIFYEDIIIIYKKEREKLKPNIFLNVSFGKLDTTIRGTLCIVCRENNSYKSLNENQINKYKEFIKRESFSYKHFDENGKYLSNKELRKKKKSQVKATSIINPYTIRNERDSILASILKCQLIIVEFIREYMSDN